MMESEEKSQEIRSHSVLYRVLAGIFGTFAGIILLLGLLSVFFPPQSKVQEPDTFTAGMFLLLPCLICGLFAWRSEVVGDENGLRWRRLLRWKSARWDEVRDFYLSGVSRSQSFYRVETTAGTISFGLNSNTKAIELAALVAQRATKAKAHDWGVYGLRGVDMQPQIFRYGNGENWFFGSVYPVLFGVGTLWPLYLLLIGSNAIREWAWGLLQMPLGLMLIGVGGAFLIWACFLVSFLFFFNWARENWERRHETIEITQQGIIWKKGEQEIGARWDEINEFHKTRRPLQHSLYWLETVHGGFAFSQAISRFGFLLSAIRQRAPHLKVRAESAEYTLGDEKLKWSGKQIGKGARIFHYRTTTNRALLWMPTALCLLPLIIPVVRSVDTEPKTDDAGVFLWLISMAMLALSVSGWLHFYRASLRVSDEGLEQIHLFGRKFIAWPDIQKLERKPGSDYFVRGENTTIAVKNLFPADWEELKEIIARRAINADGWQETQNKSSGNEIAKHRQS